MYKYIYKTINLLNGKSYVGQHTTYKEYDSYLGSGSELKKDIKKHGSKYFIKGIIEYCDTQEELNDKEKYWIKELNTIENGYNISEGGSNGYRPIGELNPFFNKKHSEETIKHLSEIRMGKEPWNKGTKGQHLQEWSEETRQKVSENNTGVKNWNYGKKGELSPSFGLKRTQENIQKLSETKKGAKNPNVGAFQILTPDGESYIATSGLPEFLNSNSQYNVKVWVLYHSVRLNKEYKGWKVTKIH